MQAALRADRRVLNGGAGTGLARVPAAGALGRFYGRFIRCDKARGEGLRHLRPKVARRQAAGGPVDHPCPSAGGECAKARGPGVGLRHLRPKVARRHAAGGPVDHPCPSAGGECAKVRGGGRVRVCDTFAQRSPDGRLLVGLSIIRAHWRGTKRGGAQLAVRVAGWASRSREGRCVRRTLSAGLAPQTGRQGLTCLPCIRARAMWWWVMPARCRISSGRMVGAGTCPSGATARFGDPALCRQGSVIDRIFGNAHGGARADAQAARPPQSTAGILDLYAASSRFKDRDSGGGVRGGWKTLSGLLRQKRRQALTSTTTRP